MEGWAIAFYEQYIIGQFMEKHIYTAHRLTCPILNSNKETVMITDVALEIVDYYCC